MLKKFCCLIVIISSCALNITAFDNRLYLDVNYETDFSFSTPIIGGTGSWIGRGKMAGILTGVGYSKAFNYFTLSGTSETMDAFNATVALTTGGSGNIILYIGPTLSILNAEAASSNPVAWEFIPTLGIKIDGFFSRSTGFTLGLGVKAFPLFWAYRDVAAITPITVFASVGLALNPWRAKRIKAQEAIVEKKRQEQEVALALQKAVESAKRTEAAAKKAADDAEKQKAQDDLQKMIDGLPKTEITNLAAFETYAKALVAVTNNAQHPFQKTSLAKLLEDKRDQLLEKLNAEKEAVSNKIPPLYVAGELQDRSEDANTKTYAVWGGAMDILTYGLMSSGLGFFTGEPKTGEVLKNSNLSIICYKNSENQPAFMGGMLMLFNAYYLRRETGTNRLGAPVPIYVYTNDISKVPGGAEVAKKLAPIEQQITSLKDLYAKYDAQLK